MEWPQGLYPTTACDGDLQSYPTSQQGPTNDPPGSTNVAFLKQGTPNGWSIATND